MAQLEPWERVYLNLGEKTFAQVDYHGTLGCVSCHSGRSPVNGKLTDTGTIDELTALKESAHDSSAGFRKYPSSDPETSCGPCHSGKVQLAAASSLHQNLHGEQYMIAIRAGFQSLDEAPESLNEDGFRKECMNCHASCGECHVVRPRSVKGGFINSHSFNSEPDMVNNCLACHGSRIATDYTGKEFEDHYTYDGTQDYSDYNINKQPDVHYQLGFTCTDCHKENMHGDGTVYTTRYHVSGLPQCTDCHSNAITRGLYHLTHGPQKTNPDAEELSCYVCHSQPYYSCNNCHVGGEWSSTPSYGYNEYPSFRIGLVPGSITENDPHNRTYKWNTLRHIPISSETYANWGESTSLPNFDAEPTWKNTSPHNIIRWTAQTLADSTWLDSPTVAYADTSCSEKCHYHSGKTWANPVNKHLYLTESYLDSVYLNEKTANSSIMVQGCTGNGTCHQ